MKAVMLGVCCFLHLATFRTLVTCICTCTCVVVGGAVGRGRWACAPLPTDMRYEILHHRRALLCRRPVASAICDEAWVLRMHKRKALAYVRCRGSLPLLWLLPPMLTLTLGGPFSICVPPRILLCAVCATCVCHISSGVSFFYSI